MGGFWLFFRLIAVTTLCLSTDSAFIRQSAPKPLGPGIELPAQDGTSPVQEPASPPQPTPSAAQATATPPVDEDNEIPVNLNWDEPGAEYLGMKTLILFSNRTNTRIPSMYLDGLDSPYIVASILPDLSKPSFYAIVVADLGWNKGNFGPIREYAKKYNVRLVFLSARPNSLFGTSPSRAAGLDAITVLSSPTAVALAGIVNTTTAWPAPAVLSPRPGSTINKRPVTGILKFTKRDERNAADDGTAYAAVITSLEDGPEEMHFYFDAAANELDPSRELTFIQSGNDITSLNLAMGNIWHPWVTRGLFLGKRRHFIQVQVDDLFLATTVWNSTNNVRCDGGDFEYNAKYSQELNQRLPEGSSFKIEMAFCGGGRDAMKLEEQGYGEGLNAAADELLADYNWVSHTWSHPNLDYLPPSECDGKEYTCPTQPQRVLAELDYNVKTLTGQGIDSAAYLPVFQEMTYATTSAGILFHDKADLLAQRFSPSSLVTPEISGLWPKNVPVPADWAQGKPIPGNTPVVKVIKDFGITTVVGDNSRPELINKTSYHYGVWMTNDTYGVEGVLIIPRYPTSVPFNAPTPEVMMNQYAALKSCLWVPGTQCPDDYDNYTVDDAMLRLGKYYAFNMLQWRADPYMFHQANLVSFAHNGKRQSLISMMVDAVVSEVQRYVVTPILSPRMDETGVWYRERMQRDSCGLSGQIKLVRGQWQMLQVNSTSPCEAVVTFVKGVNDSIVFKPFLRNGTGQVSENYGGDVTIRLPLQGTANASMSSQLLTAPPSPFADLNYILDPSFENATDGTIGISPPWLGSASLQQVGHTGGQSLKVTGFRTGVTQIVTLDQNEPLALRVSAWSLSNSITPNQPGPGYALQVVATYSGNSTRDTYTKEFPTDTIGWSRASITMQPKSPVEAVEVSLIFRGYLRGAVLFDDVSLQQALPTAM